MKPWKTLAVVLISGLVIPATLATADDDDLGIWYELGRQEARRENTGLQIVRGIDRAVNNIRAIRERRMQEQREAELYNSLQDRIDQINRAAARGESTPAEAEEKIYATKMQHFELWQQKTADAERAQAVKEQAQAMKEQANAMNKQARAIENAAYEQAQAARSSGGYGNSLSLGGVHCTTTADSMGRTSHTDCY